MNPEINTQKPDELFGHPKGLYILFFTEMWERFSYYGMRAILVLYLITSATGKNPGLGWDNQDALALYGWYTMLVYLMSIPGGILADKFVGQKKAVFIGGLILVFGHSILAITAPWAFFLGLALIVIGVGALKPNISTMVGGLYPEKDPRRDGGFTIFYIGINLGAFLAAIIVGYVGEEIGWHYGFGLAGIGMLLGQIVYMMGQKHLVGVGEKPIINNKNQDAENQGTSLSMMFSNLIKNPLHISIVLAGIFGLSIFSYFQFEGLERYLYAALFTFLSLVAGILMTIYKEINAIEKDRFIVLLISFIIIIIFWGAFEQAGGLLNIYTDTKIDRNVSHFLIDVLLYGAGLVLLLNGIYKKYKKQDTAFIFIGLGVFIILLYSFFRGNFTDPYEIPTSVFQSVNAMFIIIFGTSVSAFWYFWARKGKENSSLFKMAIGTIIMGIGFLFLAKASNDIAQYGDKAALILLILAYLFHTIGELCASPIALSFITKVAPVKYVAIMLGVYFAATGLGNKLAGSIGESSQAEQVKITLKENPTLELNNDYKKGEDLELVGSAYLEDDQIEFTPENNLLETVQIDNENSILLKEYLLEEKATKEKPETVIARYTYDLKHKEKINTDNIKTNSSLYNGNIEVFKYQNKLEFKTYIYIFILTLIFGLLLLVFLKKLKKLTHGAEDIQIVK